VSLSADIACGYQRNPESHQTPATARLVCLLGCNLCGLPQLETDSRINIPFTCKSSHSDLNSGHRFDIFLLPSPSSTVPSSPPSPLTSTLQLDSGSVSRSTLSGSHCHSTCLAYNCVRRRYFENALHFHVECLRVEDHHGCRPDSTCEC